MISRTVDNNTLLPDGSPNPNYGQVTEVVTPDPPTQKRVCSREEVIDLLPAALLKTLRDTVNATVIKRYEKFKARNTFTFAQGASLLNDLQASGLISEPDNASIQAAWPVA